MEQHLVSGQIAEADLDAPKRAFEAATGRHRGLRAFLSLEEPPSLRGSETLEFRGLANRAALVVNRSLGDEAWKVWLEILLGYLLQNDDLGEFVAKSAVTSKSRGSGLRTFEAYSIKRLLEASALCCSWLTTTGASKLVPKPVATLANSSAPAAGPAADCALDEAPANPPGGSDAFQKLFAFRSVPHQSRALEILRNAMQNVGLNPPRLARKIAAVVGPQRGRTAKFDRSTLYRILNGETTKPHSVTLHGIIEALELDSESTEIVRQEFGTFRAERPKEAL